LRITAVAICSGTMPAADWGAAGEVAASRHGALTRTQAGLLGLGPHAIDTLRRRGHVTEPTPGVLTVVGAPVTWRQRLTVATMGCNGAAAAAFRSAAVLHGMDGYNEPPKPDRIELLTAENRHYRGLDVVLHTGPFSLEDLTVVDGIACTTIARTLCDLGSVEPLHRVREAFEWAWRTGVSLTWLQCTVDRLHRPGQRGTGVLQRLLVEARRHERPTESGLEVELACILDDIPGLVRQFEVFDSAGTFVARVDFAVPDARLAIEAHSRRHHFGPTAEARDLDRHQRLAACDWTTMYVTKREMSNPVSVRRRVLAAKSGHT
jgi:very-short-patch-repair endonuclease